MTIEHDQVNWELVSACLACTMYIMICVSLLLITLNFLMIMYIIA